MGHFAAIMLDAEKIAKRLHGAGLRDVQYEQIVRAVAEVIDDLTIVQLVLRDVVVAIVKGRFVDVEQQLMGVPHPALAVITKLT